ncbi:MAG TPA: beta-galactosidase family protein [Ignavibacteriaceae bacterium]|nr:beta-galactosidase family protein [Ignavibacteriaceae bacterium]
MIRKILLLLSFLSILSINIFSQTFSIKDNRFLLDGKLFQLRSGEMHFQRIPHQYWQDRLQKLKAMGMNTVAIYVFWNALETEQGKWDFTGRNNIREFIKLAQKTGLFVLLRPGPYTCAEWDFGGLPPWLLSIPDIKVRCMDKRYISSVEKYIERLSLEVKDLQNSNGGPVIMLQIENEYGSYGNDKEYLNTLKKMWEKSGINIPFYTSDGATPYMLEAGTVKGAAIGLDPAVSENEFKVAENFAPDVPIFCSEYYPGWLTHWGEKWAETNTEDVVKDLKWLMDNKKSFNIYVTHGGTNFGWTAGANMSDKYEPTITSYDYDAPISENGSLTPKYFAVRKLMQSYLPEGIMLTEIPETLPSIKITNINFTGSASIFDNLPTALKSVQPKPMEFYNQYHGFILYRTKLVGRHYGKLQVTDLHDYANVYIDGKYLASLDRSKKTNTIEIPKSDLPAAELEILVEGMGRINFGQYLIDRKGITDRVTLSEMTLMNWEVYNLPMEDEYLSKLKFKENSKNENPGVFFKGSFELNELGDTYLDMSKWGKGVVWVNGNNLGRYWNIGPQQRLFLPAPFLKKGKNEIIIFDLHKTEPSPIRSFKELK